ncbi:hypothetical protein KIH74_30540 [Kineosporia sp. J2-2]|uniref:Uncharacterized protein n=1 Tax=Kineosporia corallincola TaxID=2835133 RepID=A0ABS5TR89_9ACTN|nr:hypothetical protein [Kineosporia corallincola]MBT0773323.1 hypothetical protein [Kineosporia corallincola]
MHPLEQLALDVANGDLTPARGEQEAAALARSGRLPAPDLLNWFKTAEWLAHQEDLWERALLLGRLLSSALEALQALPALQAPETLQAREELGEPDAADVVGRPAGDSSSRPLTECRSAWLELVHLCVIHRPDGALFASGRRAGLAALEAARAGGDQALEGLLLYRLGTLHLDPFSRAGDLWWEEHRLWLSLSPAPMLSGLPEPADALRTAESYLRQAAALREGAGLGYTLKALAQALQQQEFLAREGVRAQTASVPDEMEASATRVTRATEVPGVPGVAGAPRATGPAGPVSTADVAELCDRALALVPADDLVARANIEALRAAGSGAGMPMR